MTQPTGPLVSVVIPAFNAERYLGDAIESVLSQTYSPIEIVVVDDGSTDATGDVAHRFETVQVYTQPNLGTSAARNTGVSHTTGSLVSFLDADDLFRPSKTMMQVDVFRADPSVDAVFAEAVEFFSPEIAVADRPRVHITTDAVPVDMPTSGMVSREALDVVGPFADLAAAESIDWFLRARDAGLHIVRIPEIVYDRRIHLSNSGVVHGDRDEARLAVLRQALKRKRESDS